MERYQDAVESYNEALALDPNYGDAWNECGTALAYLGRYEESVESYDRALLVNSNNASTWYNRGNVLVNLERNQEAVESYDRARAIDANQADTWNNRGAAFNNLGALEEALESYGKAAAIDPGNPSYRFNIASVQFTMARDKIALDEIEQYLKSRPMDANAWDVKGCLLLRLRVNQQALAAFERACTISPSNAMYHYHMGVVLKRLKRRQEAVRHFRLALQQDEDFQEAAEALQHMESERPTWWEWWFQDSWPRRIVGVTLSALLLTYAVMPLFGGNVVIAGGLTLNVGRSIQYYLLPVSLIGIVLLLPSILKWGRRTAEIDPLPSRQRPHLAPISAPTESGEEGRGHKNPD
jgi:tetratricopeptide (TPR) repeat protein